MKGLGTRLRRTLGSASHAPSPPSAFAEEFKALRGSLERREHGLGEHRSLLEACGGHPMETPFGPVWLIEHETLLECRHGERQLSTFFERTLLDAARVCASPELAEYTPDDVCFLDIEATGLEHGAGTMAFLVGLAFRQGGSLITRQYLLREPSEEKALLYALLNELRERPLFVTFNGKSYDLSLLETRLVLSRLLESKEYQLKANPHLDLLHLSRNLHRGRWSDTRLGTLESELLGFHRVDDLPGALVPSAWFHFLRTKDASMLGKAVTHNLHDIWSMVVLADHLLETASLEATPKEPAQVQANLGYLLVRRREYRRAIKVLEPLLRSEPERPETYRRALDALALAARRTQDSQLEIASLQRLNLIFPNEYEVLTRLAIASERRAKNIPLALSAALQAHALCPSAKSSGRVRRLERKQSQRQRVAC